MDKSFKNLTDSSKSVLILLPTNPVFDQVASGLALFLAISDKKTVNVACSTDMVVEFNRLIGVNKIKRELGNKNLSITLAGYNPDNIEKVSYDLEENGEMKLNVITKPDGVPPREDQVKLVFTGIAADLVILIGGMDAMSFPQLSSKDLADKKVVHIGTQEVKVEGRSIISFDRPSSSISELTGSLIKESGFPVDSDIATNLVMGIEEGSKNFTANGVTADTFAMIAELMKLGGKRVSQVQATPKNFPVGVVSQQGQNAPQSWLEPKIYKGTSVS